MNEEALFTPRLLIRAPQEQDETVFLETMALSRELHYPWIFPPLTRGAFGAYLARVSSGRAIPGRQPHLEG